MYIANVFMDMQQIIAGIGAIVGSKAPTRFCNVSYFYKETVGVISCATSAELYMGIR